VQRATPELTNGHRDVNDNARADLVISSDPAAARRVQEEIALLLQKWQYGKRDLYGICLALEEALINAIKHGNQMDPTKKVQIAVGVTAERFEIRITDEGSGFDPTAVADPTAVENLKRACGRGLMLMRHYMTEVHFNARGNSVSMRKIVRK
jgi:serine/threonine-protein kinase RsbW